MNFDNLMLYQFIPFLISLDLVLDLDHIHHIAYLNELKNLRSIQLKQRMR